MITKEDFLAKSNGQTIWEHTDDLLMLFNSFCDIYGHWIDEKTKELIMLAATYHDLGKINSAFQYKIHQYAKRNPEKFVNRLNRYKKTVNQKEVPHGILSGTFLSREVLGLEKEDYAILVTAVVNHHLRSLDNQDSYETLREIVKNDLSQLAKICGDLTNPEAIRVTKYNFFKRSEDVKLEDWLKYAKVKGMLNKLDYAASGGKEEVEIAPSDARQMCLKSMEKKGYRLRECQDYLMNKGSTNVIMIASTGAGKTEAAMLWAGQDKTFYTLPYKVSIDAMYQRIIDDNYYESEKCVILHSDTFSRLLEVAEKDDEIENAKEKSKDILEEDDKKATEIFNRYESIKNLSYPFTICTVDQLFLFTYRAHGTELVAASLSYSKVIIDEIQAYDPKILAKILKGLVMINKMGGKFLVMTATLPPFIKKYLEVNIKDLEVSQKLFKNNDINIRHIPTLIDGEMDFEQVARQGQNKKVLVICNTVSKAVDAYKQIKECIIDLGIKTEVNLLHNKFIQKDRLAKEEQIKEFAESSDVGIWVSTQLVEASLDIDFDILFTEMSTADSLLQRMGRCYRKREYKESTPNIIIYDNKSGIGKEIHSVYDEEIYYRSVTYFKEYCNKPFSEEDKQKYIEKVYDIEEIKSTKYYKTFEEELKSLDNLLAGEFKLEEAKKKFRNIENITAIPFDFLNQAKEIISSLEKLPNDKKYKLKRKKLEQELKKLTLQINPRSKDYSEHYDAQLKKYHLVALNNNYNNNTGLEKLSAKGECL